jgi:hypothetical protein
MHSSRPHGRRRLLAAIVISLSVHALVGLGWLSAHRLDAAGGSGLNAVVEEPDEQETVLVVRDRPVRITFTQKTLQTNPSPPAPDTLPPSLLKPPAWGPGAVQPIGVSPGSSEHLPKSGGQQSVHGRLTAGTTVVYVLDRSASMGPDGLLRRAVAALDASLSELGPDQRFLIVAYNRRATTFPAQPASPTPDLIDAAAHWLAALPAEGGSDHRAGFREALAAKPSHVYLLTDADDLEESDVRAIAAWIRTPIRVSAAVFGGRRPTARTPLDRLTGTTGGSVVYFGP